jgi:hypothetical protein
MSDKPVIKNKNIKSSNFMMASQKRIEEQKKKKEEDVKKKLTSPVKNPLINATPLPVNIISLDDEMEAEEAYNN